MLPTRQVTTNAQGEVNAIVFNIRLENPERLDQWLRLKEDYKREAKALFLQTVFQIHKYLIRVSPDDTGELKGGWTSILSKYNQDFSMEVQDYTLYDSWKQQNKTQRGREYHFSMDQVMKGASQSRFEESEFDITVINNVPHAEYLEFGTSKIQGRLTTELARYKGEYWFNEIFNEWFEEIAREEKIVPAKPQQTKQTVN